MAVRKVITRSKKTFRVKFPSRKNTCTVHCESILEGDCALFLEISPFVKSYRAQPREETYYDGEGRPRRYVPDFEVTLVDDSTVDVEVKPKKKLADSSVKDKLEAIARRYQEQGRRFRIFTEEHLQPEPLHSNLRLLAYLRRTPLKVDAVDRFGQILRTKEISTVADAAAILGGQKQALGLIAAGLLGADLNVPLGPASVIWVRNISTEGENDPLRI